MEKQIHSHRDLEALKARDTATAAAKNAGLDD